MSERKHLVRIITVMHTMFSRESPLQFTVKLCIRILNPDFRKLRYATESLYQYHASSRARGTPT